MMLVNNINEQLDKQLTFKLQECIIPTTLRTFQDALFEFTIQYIKDLQSQHVVILDGEAIAKKYGLPRQIVNEALHAVSLEQDSFPLLDATSARSTNETNGHDAASTNIYISGSESSAQTDVS